MDLKNTAIYLIEQLSNKEVDGEVNYIFYKDAKVETIVFWHRDKRYQHNLKSLVISSDFIDEHQNENLKRIETILNSKGEVLIDA